MILQPKMRMRFHEFHSRSQYEAVEIKYHFKDLQYSSANNSSIDVGKPYTTPIHTIFSDAFLPDLLKVEKIYGILTRANMFNNIVSPSKSTDSDSIKQRVLKSILLPNGSQLENNFDDYGRLIRTHYPDGVSMIYNYNDIGNLSYIISANDLRIDLNYDAIGRIVEIRHSKEGIFQYDWNSLDSFKRVKYPDSSEVHLKWDGNNRLSELKYKSDKLVLNRDKTGRLIGLLINDSVPYEFPKLNNKKSYDLHWVTNDDGKFSKVITPVGIFLFDGKQRIKVKIGIDGQVTIYRYDKDENLRSIWNYGGAALIEHYGNSSFAIIHSDGLRTLHLVDKKRPITYMINPFGVSMESYNEEKKMVTLINDKGLRVINKFDKKGRIKGIEHPIDGKTLFIYKGDDILQKVTMQNGVEIMLDYGESKQHLQKITCMGTNIDVLDLVDKVINLSIFSIAGSSLTVQEVN